MRVHSQSRTIHVVHMQPDAHVMARQLPCPWAVLAPSGGVAVPAFTQNPPGTGRRVQGSTHNCHGRSSTAGFKESSTCVADCKPFQLLPYSLKLQLTGLMCSVRGRGLWPATLSKVQPLGVLRNTGPSCAKGV